jgi:hypothetical protein
MGTRGTSDGTGSAGSEPAADGAPVQLSLHYDENFLIYHAGSIIHAPEVAIVELVANCWDAGADTVNVTWPKSHDEVLAIEDNGTGMTREEFERRWLTLNYNRRLEQGDEVIFPEGTRKRKRTAFGRNGIGRHAMFCFGREYHVETRKNGRLTHARVTRTTDKLPFSVQVIEDKGTRKSHGTKIWCHINRVTMSEEEVRDLIGSRFVADPDFKIHVNGREVLLKDLEHLCVSMTVAVDGYGDIVIRRYDAERAGRTSKQSGVAWWVNKRLVGEPSWDVIGDSLLDARTATAKRYTYVVEVDMLAKHVKPDWSGFYTNPPVNVTRRAVHEFILDDLRALTKDLRRERKRALLEQNRNTIAKLPVVSQEQVATFAESLQLQCPTISEKELANAVQLFASMEKARTGYSLLEKMAGLNPADIDGLDSILDEWSVSDAKKVLSELRYRLELIKQLEKLLVERDHADELHELQPLFAKGLWIFGPEFDSVDFMSNRTLATVVREFFGGGELSTPDRRPDFVILPERSIGVYSRDAYDERQQVSGYDRVVIIELKRGGSTISFEAKDQALQYVRQLRRSGKIGKEARIEAYVLGSSVEPLAEDPAQEANAHIIPRTFAAVLRTAHARTFNLLRRIELAGTGTRDPELEAVLAGTPRDLFDQD